jgi:hypothetical protein
MDFKEKYLLAKKNGVEELAREDEISLRICKVVSFSAQIALIQDQEKKPAKYAKYQTFRKSVIAEVDAEIAEIIGGAL